MNLKLGNNNKVDILQKIIFWLCSAFVFSVVVIRAHTIPMYMDEIFTFFKYIRGGEFLPFFSHLDANNHFVNSAFSWVFYKLFGDSNLVLRLTNVLSFVGFIWILWLTFKQSTNKWIGLLWSLSLLFCIHTIEYFALSRGYGLSIFFMTSCIYFLIRTSEEFSIKHLSALWISSSFMLWSNLGTLITYLMVGMVSVILILSRNNESKDPQFSIMKVRHQFLKFYILPLIPSVILILLLKKNQLLYHGFEEGFFRNSLNVLMKDVTGVEVLGKLLLIVIGVAFLYSITFLLARRFINKTFDLSPLMISILAIGTIAGIVLLNLILGVALPKDRTTVYLFYLIVPAVYYLLDKVLKKRGLLISGIVLGLVLFGFVKQFNTSMVLGWKYELVTSDLCETLLDENQANAIISGKGIFGDEFNFFLYSNDLNHNHSVENKYDYADYIISNYWEKDLISSVYDTLFYNPISTVSLLKRNSPFIYEKVGEYYVDQIYSEEEFTNILRDTLFTRKERYCLEIEFASSQKLKYPKFWIVAVVKDANNNIISNEYINALRIKESFEPGESFTQRRMINLSGSENKLHVYLWNTGGSEVSLQDLKITLYKQE